MTAVAPYIPPARRAAPPSAAPPPAPEPWADTGLSPAERSDRLLTAITAAQDCCRPWVPLQPAATLAPASSPAAWEHLRSRRLAWLSHSGRGQVGVDFYAHDGDGDSAALTVKRAASVEREWLAGQLAADAGCCVPWPMALAWGDDPAWPRSLTLTPGQPTLLMPYVPGHNFFELSRSERGMLQRDGDPAALRLGLQLGYALAFDLFSGNTDRFAGLGPYGTNLGNLMLDGERLVLIDNAIHRDPELQQHDDLAQRRWHHKVRCLLTLADGDGTAEARLLLRRAASFITAPAQRPDAVWRNTWAGWLVGLRAGIVGVARIDHHRLDLQAARLVPQPAQLAPELALLHANLSLFRAAAPTAQAALERSANGCILAA